MTNGNGKGWSALGSMLITLLSGFSIQLSGIFLPIFAGKIGASKLEIGIIGGSYGLAYLASSLFSGRLSDIRGRVIFIRLGLGLATASYAAQLLAGTPLVLTLVRALLGFCIAMSDAALMAFNFEVGGRTSRFTSLGALGWLAGGVLTIFVQDYSLLFLLSAIACGGAFLISWSLPEPENRKLVRPNVPAMLRRNFRVYIPFLLRNIGGNMIWFIFPVYLVGIGTTKSWIAILQCMNTGVQFVVMMFLDRFSATRLYMFGLLSSVVVFVGYALARNYLQMIPMQIILALSWSSLYLGSLMLLFRNNEERATCAAMLFSMGSLSQAVGPFIGGFMVQLWGYPPLMYGAAGLCLAGVGIVRAPAGREKQSETQSKST